MAYPEKVTYNSKYNLKPIVEPDGQFSAQNANELKEKINRNALFHDVHDNLSALQAAHPNPPVGAFAYLIDGSHYRCVNVGWTTNEGSGSGSGSTYFKGYHLSLAALKAAHPVATPGDRAIIKVTGANDKEALWDEDDQDWFAFEFVSGGTSAPEDQTKLLSFVSGWDSGFTYYPFARFRIDGIESTDTRERTLSAANPDLPRKDQFAIEIATKQIVVLEGVPGENPADPNINLETHLPGPIVDIPAGATEPVGASKKLIFDEGVGAPDEWPVTSITFAVTETSPITGTKSLEGTNLPKGAFVRFDPANPVLLSEFTQLQLKIKNKVASSGELVVYFHGTRPNGKLVSYREIGFLKNFGYDPNNTTDVQKIILPVSASDVQSLRSLYVQNNNETSEAFGCFIDEVLQGATAEDNVVSGDYATREELEAAKQEAIDTAISYTDQVAGADSGTSVKKRYATWADLLANQAAQLDKGIYYAADASGHSKVDAGWAYFEYLGTSLGTEEDYKKLTEEESQDITLPTATETKTALEAIDALTLTAAEKARIAKIDRDEIIVETSRLFEDNDHGRTLLITANVTLTFPAAWVGVKTFRAVLDGDSTGLLTIDDQAPTPGDHLDAPQGKILDPGKMGHIYTRPDNGKLRLKGEFRV